MTSSTGLAAASLLLIASGCYASESKGEEENPFDDARGDTFINPTEHGELSFFAANEAAITDDTLYHSWTFTLTGPADVSLRTVISNNLDTVMYLYRRPIGSDDNWGRYYRKNDDHEGNLWSQIDFRAEAAEYRIKIKGFKSSHRGAFSVVGECEGEGCPQAPVCDEADGFGELPGETPFTQACADRLLGLLAAPITSEATERAAESEVCSLSPAGKHGADLLRAYWHELVGWDERKAEIAATELYFERTHHHHDTGTSMLVETDVLDEEAITVWADADDQLLALFVHDQFPDERWFCGAQDEAALAAPSCFEDMFRALTHHERDREQPGTAVTTCHEAFELPDLVGDPVCEFTFAHGLRGEDAVDVSYTRWSSTEGLLGAEVTLAAGEQEATYYVGTTFGLNTVVFAVTEADGRAQFPCLELR